MQQKAPPIPKAMTTFTQPPPTPTTTAQQPPAVQHFNIHTEQEQEKMQVDESAIHTFGEEEDFKKRYPTPSPTPSRRSQSNASRGASPYSKRKDKERETQHRPMGHKVAPTITKERRRETHILQETDQHGQTQFA